jgi:O-antigen ligase
MTAIAAGSESFGAARGERRPGRRSLVTWLALAAVAFTFAVSGIVFTEPAPVDALSIGLTVLLPVIGLVAFNRVIFAYGALWLVAGACAVLAATFSLDIGATMTHVGVTLYLYAASFVIAGFIAKSPRAHTELILKAWTFAALIASTAAIVGYFGLVPGSEMFTLYDRASGTFKDPNVLGPFVIVPLIYMLNIALDSRLRGMIIPLAIAAFLMLAVFLSFSRGAWFNLVVSLAIFGYMALATTRKSIVRLKIVGLLAVGSIIAVGVVLAAVSNDQVAELLSQRASLDQSYDTGAEGRFGGQEKALGLILDNPLGIGAQEFVSRHHAEEVHNVYLTVLLSAGWLGGGIYLILVCLTLVLGFRHLMRATDTRMLFLVVYSTFAATALEGVIIDSDHWRHFYVLMAIIWGFLASTSVDGQIIPRRAPRLIGPQPRAAGGPRRPRIIGPAPHPA